MEDKNEKMTTMNVSLPESLRKYAEERARTRYSSASEYIRTSSVATRRRPPRRDSKSCSSRASNPANPWSSLKATGRRNGKS